MTLLLLDLDDTLIDRVSAIRAWAREFLGGVDAPQSDVDWLLDLEAGAQTMDGFARSIKQRYRLEQPMEELIEAILDGFLAGCEISPGDQAALRAARDAGWTPVIVTNGAVATQERKIRRSGLDRMVAGWVVSEEVDVWKPDPHIFEIAAKRAGHSLAGAWMVGDNPYADIAGARNAGIASVWLHHGREWPDDLTFAPSRTAGGCAEAIRLILGAEQGTAPPP